MSDTVVWDRNRSFFVDGIEYRNPRYYFGASVEVARPIFEIMDDSDYQNCAEYDDDIYGCPSWHGVSHSPSTPYSEQLWLTKGILDSPENADFWLNPHEWFTREGVLRDCICKACQEREI